MLASLVEQETWPRELILVDASDTNATKDLSEEWSVVFSPNCEIIYRKTQIAGAASQRNEGVNLASQEIVAFFDDDILFESCCLERLWRALETDAELGGVNAMITNQQYHPPGIVGRLVFTLLAGRIHQSFAGRVIGPAVNLLPEDRDDLPEVVPVEWLNTTCTLYRREALPNPPFDSVFSGYSLMEDLTLSLRVRERWRLANVRTARIFHDSQPGSHKSDRSALAEMELVNRHYVMARVLERNGVIDYGRLLLWESFQLLAAFFRKRSIRSLKADCLGKFRALSSLRSTLTRESD